MAETAKQRTAQVLLEHLQVTQSQVPGAVVANPCLCGWGEWGKYHVDHVAEKLQEAELLIPEVDNEQAAGRYTVTLYTQAQVTLTIDNPRDAEDAAVRAINNVHGQIPASIDTGLTNFGTPVKVNIETGDWRVLEVTDEDGNEVV